MTKRDEPGMKAFHAAVLCLLLLTARPTVGAPPFPLKSTLKFDSASPYAMLIFESGEQRVVREWNIEVLSFDPQSRGWTYGPLKGWARFSPIKIQVPGERTFQAALVAPSGVYAINNISARFWHTCFDAGTQAFELAAGKVNYIGRIDPDAALQLLKTLPPKSRHGQHWFSFGEVKLTLTPPSAQPDWNDAVSHFLAHNFPKVTAPVVAAEPFAVSFEPGHSALAGKICQKY